MTQAQFIAVRLNEQHAASRRETFLGRSFRVVPAVLVRSQVLHNNLGPVFLPMTEVTEDWAEQWNGVPVLVGPHPESSGRDPVLFNERGAGWLYNVHAVQESSTVRHLRGEAWLDESRADAVPGLPEVLAFLDAGQVVELSTGFPAQIREEVGSFAGAVYNSVIMPVGVDHLIITTELTGACAVAHGCGLGVANLYNAEQGKMTTTTKEPATAEPQGESKFMAMLKGLFSVEDPAARVNREQWEANTGHRIAREYRAINAVPVSDQERVAMLRTALQNKFGAQDREVVVTDVFSADGRVVFWFSTPLGPQPPGAEFFQAEYTSGDTGAFTFTEPVRVRRMLSYEPTAASNAAPVQAKNGCKCGGQGHNHSTTGEGDMQDSEKKELMTELTAAITAAIKPVADAVANIDAKISDKATEVVNAALKPINDAVTAVQASVNAALKLVNAERDAERQALVTELTTNERTEFTAAELETKPLEELRKIARLANVDVSSFAGRGGPRSADNSNGDDEPEFMPVAPYTAKVTKTEDK